MVRNKTCHIIHRDIGDLNKLREELTLARDSRLAVYAPGEILRR
jgi:hypothetical protein